MEAKIRRLDAEDAAAYRDLRLRALAEHPEAFATSAEEERARPLAEVVQRLEAGPEQVTLGAFDRELLVGMATLTRPARSKLRHRATLAAMYVVPEARGHGLARALLDAVLEIVGEWGVSDVALGVTVGNDAARKLYTSAGFVPYGIEPRTLLVEGRFHDVEWMNLRLR
jgi:GNAT superfamily N-acetyltransferase